MDNINPVKFELKYLQSRTDIRDYEMLPRELKLWETIILGVPCVIGASYLGNYFPDQISWVEKHFNKIISSSIYLILMFTLIFFVQAIYINIANFFRIYNFKPSQHETKIIADENGFEFEQDKDKYSISWLNTEIFLFKNYVVIYPLNDNHKIIIPARAFACEDLRLAFIKMAVEANNEEEVLENE